MVTIISKGGPRGRGEETARKIVDQNRGKIEHLIHSLKGGPLPPQATAPPAAPRTIEERAFFRRFSASLPASKNEPQPYLRISLNNRVIIADLNSARQLHFLGELRGTAGARRFALATRENGFFEPLDDALRAQLGDLDGQPIRDDAAADALAATIRERLGLPAE